MRLSSRIVIVLSAFAAPAFADPARAQVYDSVGQRLATCGDQVKGLTFVSQNGDYRPSVPRGIAPGLFVEAEAAIGHGKSQIPTKNRDAFYSLIARSRMRNVCGLPQFVVRRNPQPASGPAEGAPEAAYHDKTVRRIDASPDEMERIMALVQKKKKPGDKTVNVRVKWGEGDDLNFDLTCAVDPTDRGVIDARGKLFHSNAFDGKPAEATLQLQPLKDIDPEVEMLEAQIKNLFKKRGRDYLARVEESVKSQIELIRSDKNSRADRERYQRALEQTISEAKTCRWFMTDEQIVKVVQLLKPAEALKAQASAGTVN